MKRRVTTIVITILLTLSAGCTNLGPNHLRASRNDYNIAIQRTGDEQLLLNLVRLFALQAGKTDGSTPVLTLPVGG